MSSRGVENVVVLRLPKDHADRLREAMRTDALRDRLKIDFLSDQRHALVKFDNDILSGKLVDLPCIIESHKTLDRKSLYKTGDISQMMVCSEEPLESPPERLDNLPLAKRREVAKKYTCNHGIAPPLKNVRKRRFRKTAPKKFIESPEVEKELKRLLREDIQAVSVSFKVLTEEGRQDDVQSVLSEGDTLASRSHTPAPAQDEDSITSSSLNEDAAKSELLRMLEEVSSSSGSDNEEEEEEEEEEEDDRVDIDESTNPRVFQLQREIQQTDMEIAAQKIKIQNTANPTLRSRFESFLKQLEDHRQAKIEQLKHLMM